MMSNSSDRKYRRAHRSLWTLALATLAALGAGCSGESAPQTIPVQGKVTLDGAPVTQGHVSFIPVTPAEGFPSRPASGTIAADGTYQMSSFGENDGVVPGEYQVAIVSKSGGATLEEPDLEPEWHVPEKFATPAESGLTATVAADAAGPITLDFALVE